MVSVNTSIFFLVLSLKHHTGLLFIKKPVLTKLLCLLGNFYIYPSVSCWSHVFCLFNTIKCAVASMVSFVYYTKLHYTKYTYSKIYRYSFLKKPVLTKLFCLLGSFNVHNCVFCYSCHMFFFSF